MNDSRAYIDQRLNRCLWSLFMSKYAGIFAQISNLCDKFNALMYNIINKSVKIHYLGV